jgi:hypothetical protein
MKINGIKIDEGRATEAQNELREIPPTRVLCRKGVDLLDSKGVGFLGSGQESARVCDERS